MPSGVYKRREIIRKGDKFNKLIAIEFVEMRMGKQFWLFKCDCGREKVICVNDVKRKKNNVKSCGCLLYKHKMCKTKVYNIWRAMRQRCFNKNNKHYKDYGGRGITVCERWLKFENFYVDMGEKPQGKSIDRIDNDKGYYKKNCKWSTPEEQLNNTRINRFLTYKGKTQTIALWVKELDISRSLLFRRLKSGWSVERALSEKK